MRLGYNSNGFRSHRLDDVLPWLAELGYRAVAITPDVGCLDPKDTTPERLHQVGRRCQELDLAVVIETGARYLLDPRRKHRPNLLEVEESWRIRLDFLVQMLEWCDRLGAGVLSFWSGVLPEGQIPEVADQRLAQVAEVLIPRATEFGVALALEPEPGHHIATVADALRLRNRVSDGFGLTLDVGHVLANCEGDPAKILRDHRDIWVNLQLDDMCRGEHHHLAPGEGELDWADLAAAMSALPSELPACFELSRDSHRFHHLAPAAIAFARSHRMPCHV